MTTSSPVLQFQQVNKTYSTHKILQAIDLQIHAGEFFALIGANGAGKTTLIKSILDFSEIQQGDIRIFGTSHRHAAARQHLAFLPEHFTPPYFLTGREFLTYIAHLHGQTYSETEAIHLCQALDLPANALRQSVRDYSKGMAQKLGLLACFLSHKRLLLLDEPTSGLDSKARALLKRYLLQLKTQGITLFFTTHILSDVQMLCDRLAILHAARLRFIGTPTECCTTFNAPDLEQAYLNCIASLPPEDPA